MFYFFVLKMKTSIGEPVMDQKNTTSNKCKYCDKETQLVCLDCSQPFCNDTSDGKSHAIYHLVKSKHKKISILDKKIKCTNCTEDNLFRLGIKEAEKSKEDFVTMVENLNIRKDPIEKQREEIDNSSNTLGDAMGRIRCGRCGDLPKLVVDRKLRIYPSVQSAIQNSEFEKEEVASKIRLRFDAKQYYETFMPLIKAESSKEQEIKENMTQENVTIFQEGDYCRFTVQKTNSEFKINIGDELEFLHYSGLKFCGYVCEEQFSDQIKVKLRSQPESIPGSGYTIKFLWNPTSYRRMQYALESLYSHRKSNVIFQYIMKGVKETMKEIKIYQAAGLCKLNKSQEIAVKAALTRTLTLIQGPPGTGKTMVSAVIVYNLVKHFGKKVLVVAPSNTAADQLALKINNTGVKVLRVMSRRREDVTTDVDFLCLHKLLSEFPEESKGNAQANLIGLAEVICCTCVTAGQSILQGLEFPFILIDEAVQSTEPLSLIPCVYNPKKLILVGDHKQLGPTILNKDVVKHGLKQSLFERLMKIGVTPYMLSVQYRMHKDLCAFPSEYFYNGLLTTGSSSSRVLEIPNNFFYVCDGKEEISQTRTSFFNKSEAAIVENIIRFLFKNGVLEQQIGVITPYEGQRSHILGQIFGNEPGNLEIRNVDGFQGREKDFIIVSLVRSNIFQGVGFVGDKRRMNVTLTRAKHGLIIIGNPFTLYKSEMWADLLNWYNERGLVYEGPLNMLRKVSLESLNLKGEGG